MDSGDKTPTIFQTYIHSLKEVYETNLIIRSVPNKLDNLIYIDYSHKRVSLKSAADYTFIKNNQLIEVDIKLTDRETGESFADYYTDIASSDIEGLMKNMFSISVAFFANEYTLIHTGKLFKKTILVFNDSSLGKIPKI